MRVPALGRPCGCKVAQRIGDGHAGRLDLFRGSVVEQCARSVDCSVECRRRVCRVRSGVNGLRRSNGLPQGNNAHQVGACVNDGLAKVPALGGVVLSLRGGKRLGERGPACNRVVVLGEGLSIGDNRVQVIRDKRRLGLTQGRSRRGDLFGRSGFQNGCGVVVGLLVCSVALGRVAAQRGPPRQRAPPRRREARQLRS